LVLWSHASSNSNPNKLEGAASSAPKHLFAKSRNDPFRLDPAVGYSMGRRLNFGTRPAVAWLWPDPLAFAQTGQRNELHRNRSPTVAADCLDDDGLPREIGRNGPVVVAGEACPSNIQAQRMRTRASAFAPRELPFPQTAMGSLPRSF
jgi:hypothetical protein